VWTPLQRGCVLSVPAGAFTVLLSAGGIPRAMNGQLRTGADKGNPTV
jgi:hypothetical protein